MRVFVTVVTLSGAAMMVGIGAWCRFDAAGFARWSDWPQHAHFLHDAGVFQIAIGLMMVCALWWRDALAVALAGFLFTNAFHALNHHLDRAAGGRGSDPWLLLAVAVVAGAALAVRLRSLRKRAVPDQLENRA